jgi:uncharacterized protein (DUF58 family)
MRLDIFKDLFDKWLVESPDGRRFVKMPWKSIWFESRQDVPFYLRPAMVPTHILFWIATFITVVAIIFSTPLAASVGSGVLVLLFLSSKESWLQSGALTIQPESNFLKVHEHEEFNILLKARNQSAAKLNPTHIFLHFSGAVHQHQVLCLPELKPFEERTIAVKFKADGGMGIYQVSDVHIVTRDHFGLLPRCVLHSLAMIVEVVPEYSTMPPIQLTVAGRTAHSGSFEARASGESSNFLGLRPFREGDSIRRIHWQRSERFNDLIVKEFDRLDSTDATIIVDQRRVGLYEFEGLNSYEHLKDSVIALCHTLMNQQIRVQIVSGEKHLEFGKGERFFQNAVEFIRDLKPISTEPYEETLQRNKGLVAPDSVVIPVFCFIDLDLLKILDCFLGWDLIHAQVLPVIIDVQRFEKKIAKEVDFGMGEYSELNIARQLYGDLSNMKSFDNLARKIIEKAIVIGPDETIGQVYNRRSRWQS